MAAVEELYTLQSIGTLGGASGLVLLISKMVGQLTPLPAAPVAAVVSLLVSIAGALQASMELSLAAVIIVAGNTALLFSTATGVNETIAAGTKAKPVGVAQPQARTPKPKTWLSSWF